MDTGGNVNNQILEVLKQGGGGDTMKKALPYVAIGFIILGLIIMIAGYAISEKRISQFSDRLPPKTLYCLGGIVGAIGVCIGGYHLYQSQH